MVQLHKKFTDSQLVSVEWRRGPSPLRSHRSGREPLGSSGSYRPAHV